jgi:uncharacterized coiled-coil protein SlyX
VTWSRSFPMVLMFLPAANLAVAQQTSAEQAPAMATMEQKVERLAAVLTQQESELEASQREIRQLRRQIVDLQTEVAAQKASNADPPQHEDGEGAARLSAEVNALREQQDLQQSEISTHEQAKVESESKFPVKLTGLILMNLFANSAGVDTIQSPILAINGSGTTGLSLRQTVLGLDARGPHLFGASSAADVRVDFFGGLNQGNYTSEGGSIRLRTAHAELNWNETRAFFEMDRPIVNPNAPTSLTTIAQPPLAWSGNLWNWIPQAGAEHAFLRSSGSRIIVQGAFADIPDPATLGATGAYPSNASWAEQSRWPGSEARVGYARGDKATGLQVGAGGYFSPHSGANNLHFDAWAATIDYRVPIVARLEASGSFYRGSALGGLGGGAFKDYLYKQEDGYPVIRALDDVGGWTQLKARASERLEFNAAYGLDNAFAGELRSYLAAGSGVYQSLARNSTVFANVIYSPTAYTLFSLEYRRITSAPVTGLNSITDVYGIAAGYRF